MKKMHALIKNETCEMVEFPEGKSTLDCKWIYTLKYNIDGMLDRYKEDLRLKGVHKLLE